MSVVIARAQEAVEEVTGCRAPGRLPGGTDAVAGDVLEDEALDGPVVEIEVGELGLAEVGHQRTGSSPSILPAPSGPWTAKP